MKADEKSEGGEPPLTNGKERSGPELRGHRRISLQVPIECHAGQRTVMGTAVNISRGGALVRADQTFSWDEAVNCSFALPGSTEILQLKGRIAHVVPGAFMGLEFVELPSSALERIDQYISAALSAS
jgi:PilZ domain-containing protein